MCRNECCCKCAPARMCCCKCDSGGTSVRDTILYDEVINSVGVFTLADDINHYDDVMIYHDVLNADGGYTRQSFYSAVSCLSDSNAVCHGNGGLSAYVLFNITNKKINILKCEGSYRIVKIVGRKF